MGQFQLSEVASIYLARDRWCVLATIRQQKAVKVFGNELE